MFMMLAGSIVHVTSICSSVSSGSCEVKHTIIYGSHARGARLFRTLFFFELGRFYRWLDDMSSALELNGFIADHVRQIPRSGIREFFDIVSTQAEVISLGVGEPDFATPWHIREAAIYALEQGRTGYTSNLGLLKLRQAISTHLESHFGVQYHPETQILIAVGVSEALDIALRALINPGDEIIYHEPCYVSYSPSVTLAHGVAVPIACSADNGFAVRAEAIEQAITPRSKVLVLNFPTNPTGGTMTRVELLRIAEVVMRHNLLVITDEIYSELTFEGEHVSIASLPGMRERTIFLHGFSKAYAMTGFRIGYACGPGAIIEAMMRIHQYSMLCASIISQEAALEAIQRGDPDTVEMRDQYRLRRNYIVSALNEMGLTCHLPRGSFYAFPCIRSTGLTSKEFALRLLQEEKVACVPGGAFGASGEGYVRCCFATALDRIQVASERMARFVQRVRS
jgi:aminotransferase